MSVRLSALLLEMMSFVSMFVSIAPILVLRFTIPEMREAIFDLKSDESTTIEPFEGVFHVEGLTNEGWEVLKAKLVWKSF